MSSSLNKHVIPAFFQWLEENGHNVYLSFVTAHPLVNMVPQPPEALYQKYQFDTGGVVRDVPMMTINMSAQALNVFQMTETGLFLQCRMKGVSTDIFVPFEAIVLVSIPEKSTPEKAWVHDFSMDFARAFVADDGIRPEVKPPPVEETKATGPLATAKTVLRLVR